jgi:hypothetical protein
LLQNFQGPVKIQGYFFKNQFLQTWEEAGGDVTVSVNGSLSYFVANTHVLVAGIGRGSV